MTQQNRSKATTNRSAKGFTVIEIMIVLAVCGLIISVVFLAIPALQRTSRNNQRKQDVSAILQAVSRYELNNSANFPGDATALLQNTKLTYYNPTSGDVSLCPQGSGCYSLTPAPDSDKVGIYNYALCDRDNQSQAVSTGADYTNIVAIYTIETSSGPATKCQQL